MYLFRKNLVSSFQISNSKLDLMRDKSQPFPNLSVIAEQVTHPYIRKFVSPVGHSHHRYFVASRPITNHILDKQLRFISVDFT